jgi:hypothetical protein
VSTTTVRTQHPSNRLYGGEARDFLHATDLARASAQVERQVSRDLDRRHGALPPAERIDDGLDRYEAAAITARGIYTSVMADVGPRIVAELRAAGLDDWADAYEADDYSRLAI